MGVLGRVEIQWTKYPNGREVTEGTSFHKRLLSNLDDSGVLREVKIGSSRATTRQFWIPKGDGGHLHLGEYNNEINSCLSLAAQEMPSPVSLWISTLGADYRVVIDLKNAYWAIQIDEDSSKNLGILFKQRGWPLKEYQWLRLPQGFSASAPFFQMAMGALTSKWGGQSYCE
eukprot:GHVN01054395.1.p1 GENE.GHVN01054395.1~~GHVN01054395.1.p1  ORF type:complete len:172 (+),score=16.09 GHVN01054395.1:621-1136(+)